MYVHIYQPRKNAMQSGRKGTDKWVLRFAPSAPATLDPLMGWAGSSNTKEQVSLTFETKEQAIAYAKEKGYAFEVQKPVATRVVPKSYSDNFAHNRRMPWTH